MNQEPTASGANPILPPSGKPAGKSGQVIALILISLVLAGGISAVYAQQQTSNKTLENKYNDLQTQFTKLKEGNNAAKSNNLDKVDKEKYQSVFLNSGQVYFGKITNITDTQITLTDIYYLQNGNASSLIKLGNEIHGPEDVMYIERKDTTFWENLKPEGEVSKAIVAYEKVHSH